MSSANPTLSGPQKKVMRVLQAKYPYDAGYAVTSIVTMVDNYNAFINWRTAEALERKGLVTITNHDPEGSDVFLTEKGLDYGR